MKISKQNITFIKCTIILSFFCINLSLSAQEKSDSTYVAPIIASDDIPENLNIYNDQYVDTRIPEKGKIEKYLNDSRFNYRREKVENPEWWERFKDWLAYMISELSQGVGKVTNMGIIGYVIIIVIILSIVALIIKLTGVNYIALLGMKKVDTPDIDIYSEDVNTMNFDSLIRQAVKNRNYRLATRFLYLKNLKLLSDNEIITWNINKTNISYLYEITNPNLQSLYRDISLIFDYVWYGEFKVSDTEYAEIVRQMDNFANTITNER